MVALVGATVIDPATRRVITDAVILVRAGHIVEVGERSRVRVPRSAGEVSLPGYWIIPGLIDLHASLEPWGRVLTLRWGVTTVRELRTGADTTTANAPWPRRFLSLVVDGTPITAPGAPRIVDSAAMDALLQGALASGMRWLHLTPTVGPETMALAVRLAHARGMAVAASPGFLDPLNTARLGVVSLSHLGSIPLAIGWMGQVGSAYGTSATAGLAASEHAWSGVDPAALEQVAADLAATGITLVPTLAWHEMLSRLDDPLAFARNDVSLVPTDVHGAWPREWHRTLGWDAGTMADLRLGRRAQDRFVLDFLTAGGRVVTGSAAGLPYLVPGAGVHQEMELLVAAGASPWQALAAATVHGADLLRADSLGRLHVGAAADLVVLSGDPLHDIRNTRRIARVMLGGKWVR